MPRDLFVYGTLLCPEVWAAVVGAPPAYVAAELAGFACRRVRGEVYPAIRPAPDERVPGALVRDLEAAALARLDDYEGPLYARERHAIRLRSGVLATAEVYVLRADHDRHLSDAPWSLEAFRAGDLAAFLDAL
ncbi:MAG: gamma-glutamylcyclotransferase [Myxococcales bacterium]|nr:gamma-glutamylcyclotransferase [Myxococcales bacterium]